MICLLSKSRDAVAGGLQKSLYHLSYGNIALCSSKATFSVNNFLLAPFGISITNMPLITPKNS